MSPPCLDHRAATGRADAWHQPLRHLATYATSTCRVLKCSLCCGLPLAWGEHAVVDVVDGVRDGRGLRIVRRDDEGDAGLMRDTQHQVQDAEAGVRIQIAR